MFRLSAKFLVSFGLVIFLLGLLMLAGELNILANPKALALQSRAKLCETVAVSGSLLAATDNRQATNQFLQVIVQRNPEILSAAMRRGSDGHLIASSKRHEQTWNSPSSFPQESRVEVPIFRGSDTQWGSVEIAFQPISAAGINGFITHPWTRFMGFTGSMAFFIYYMYLGKMLKVMNAKSVPQRVRTALNTLAGGLIVTDGYGDIVLANDAVATWVGKKPETLVGRSIDSLPWSAEVQLPWKPTFKSHVPVVGDFLKLNSTEGELSLIVNASPMVGSEGKLRGVFIGLEDVTVLEQKELEHKKLREEAERANSAKSDFLARMSHEIRTPMNAILGFTDVLRRGFDQDRHEREEYLSTIHSSGEHLLALINDILDLSKVEAGRMELESTQFSPHKIILETLQVLQVKADEKGLQLAYEPDDQLPETITSDPVRLRQIVTNLVGNAIKFTEEGKVSVASRVRDNLFEFDVVDSGIGMKKDSLSRIFDPFGQADSSVTRKFGGTGLGLAIAKKFAEAMGGGISVDSVPGQGTTFTVQLSAGNLTHVPKISRDQALNAISKKADHALELTLPNCRILIVDDGKSNRKLLTLFLSRAGAEYVEAENGKEAIDRVNEDNFDVILMDMQMPIMDGYTATTTLRAQGCSIPIVALTAHAMKQDEDKCIAAGCSHFLPKPVNSNHLLQLMADILGGEVKAFPVAELHVRNSTSQPTISINNSSSETLMLDPETIREFDPNDQSEQTAAPPITSDLPMDDADFREIVVEFVDRLHQQLDDMEAAVEAAEYDDLAKLAHWLKGSGGTAGFGEFTEPSRHLELLAKQEKGDELPQALQRIRNLTNRISVP